MRSIEEQVRKTYFSLRTAAAVIAFGFPLLLWGGGKLVYKMDLRDSMSAYYHATPDSLAASGKACPVPAPGEKPVYPQAGVMRNWFVGLLFATGALLYVNKGHTEKENILLNIAGAFAAGIALFPMDWCNTNSSFSKHGLCAGIFFACIAIVSVWCSRDTVKELKPERRSFYLSWYWFWGGMMLVAPAAAYGFYRYGIHQNYAIYWAELFGIYSFGGYWVTKTFEIKRIEEDRQMRGPHLGKATTA